MKLIRLSILLMLLGVIYVPFAFSLGVAHSVIPGNIIDMNSSSTKAMDFILQNADDVTKVMVFTVETQFPLIVGDKDDHSNIFTEEYRLSPNTNKKITVKFHSPDFAGKFLVTYGYYEKNSGSGQIQIIQETSGKFYISVDDSNALFSGIGVPYEYNNYRIVTYKNGLYDHDDLLFIEKDDKARIQFYDEIDLVNFKEKYVEMAYNRVFVDADAFGQFKDKDARIYFYGLNYTKEPIILKDGKDCGNECEIISYDEDDGELVFKVDGFSEYTTKKDPSDTGVSSSSGGESAGSASSDVDLPGIKSVSDEDVVSSDEKIAKTVKKTPDSGADVPDTNVLSKGIADLTDGLDSHETQKGSVIDSDYAGVRKIFSVISWGFGTLFLSVTFLLVFIRDNYAEASQLLEAFIK